MLDKRSNEGFTKELVAVVVEEVVEELELGAIAINGGSDTMKNKAMQYRNEEENRGNLEKRNDSKGNEKFCYYID